jgi:arylsulfatase A-like enzyme
MNIPMHTSSWVRGAAVYLAMAATLAPPLPAFGATRTGTPAARRPNIVVLLADQWRAQAFGYAGDPNVKTPNLDRLAQQSVRFVNAISSVPVCCPMRATMLTGQRSLTHGVFMNDVSLNPDATTIAKVFKAAGYDTAYIGKWHVDGHGRSNFIPQERRQGFDYWKVLECTHNYNNSYYYADGPEKLKWDGYDAIAQTRDALQYIRDHAASEKPFVLFLAWGPPHDPYQTAPEIYRAKYTAVSLKLRSNVPATHIAAAREMLAGYYAHCTALDACAGEAWQTLRESGLEKDTILVFTSDHGDLLGSHAGRNKQQPYDESIRVPLLIHWPAALGASHRVLEALLTSEDLMPTLLGLSGVAIPGSVEGLDYSGYIRGGKNPSDGAALISCIAPFGQWDRRTGGREYRGIRTERHTYVRELNGPWLLFDNKTDPFQLHNLVDQPGSQKLQARLDAILQSKLKSAGDQFLPGDDYIKRWGYIVDKNGTVPYTP